MYINIVWLFLGLAVFLVLATAAIPFSLTALSRRIKRSGRARH